MLEEVFDVSQKNCEGIIMKDKTKDIKTRREDADFFNDQKGARVQKMLGKDKISQKFVKNKTKREMKIKNQRIKESVRKQKELVTEKYENTTKNFNTLDDNQDEEYLQPSRKIRKSNVVPLIVPKNIGKDLAPTASRYGISSTALSATLASLINNSSGTTDDFSISKRSILRQKKLSIRKTAFNIKDNFITLAKGKSLTVHFDSKIMLEMKELGKEKVERVAVLISSPDLSDSQLLGILIVEDGTAESLGKAIKKTLQDCELFDYVDCLSFDTTVTNTGWLKGVCTLIEQWRGKALIWMACRHHVYELHIKHFSNVLTGGKASGPKTELFDRLKGNWKSILEKKINYDNLKRFDSENFFSSFLEKQASESLTFLQNCLDNDIFPRNDYQYFIKLAVLWLGGKVTKFQFRFPMASHHARFMAQGVYYLTYDLLQPQFSNLCPNIISLQEEKLIYEIASFTALFYVPWFIKAPIPAIAPSLDLKAINEMIQYSEFSFKPAEAVLKSLKKHNWYLNERFVVMCLADKCLPVDQLQKIALKLAQTAKPTSYKMGKLNSEIFTDNEKKITKNIEDFIGPESWFLFDLLKMTLHETEWLKTSSSNWEKFSGYIRFKNYVTGLLVVNDCAERAIKLGQDFIETFRNEEDSQANLLVVADLRLKFQTTEKKSWLKTLK
ncbi:uncharacterized protein LOC136081307 [Hydra vulgaris]|uniref:Uncharacterized protein LOC136081307 n=1 Tax=Hydra vulgaris TaxID=6087 RepID=A0ABM4BZJ3_HYDVU